LRGMGFQPLFASGPKLNPLSSPFSLHGRMVVLVLR
jgi:hypothetical protein